MIHKKTTLGAIGLLSIVTSSSYAAITMTIEETALNETTITISGSWDVFFGFNGHGNSTVRNFQNTTAGYFAIAYNNIGFPSAISDNISTSTYDPAPWNGNYTSNFVSRSGDAFGFRLSEDGSGGGTGQIFAPVGYTAGSTINATWVFNKSVVGLGILGTSGTMNLNTGNSVNWIVVPEPSSALLLGLGGTVALLRRRR